MLLLGQDAEGQIEPRDEVQQRVAQEPCPGVADIAELAGQRGRRPARRRPQQLDQRAPVRADRRAGGEHGLEAADRLAVACGPLERAVVDQLAQRADGRVLVADPDQQQLLEADRRRFDGRGRRGRELEGEALQQRVRLGPEPRPQAVHRVVHGVWAQARGVAVDDEVADLVEQAEGDDVAGGDAWRAGRPAGVEPRGQPADGGEVRRDEVASDAEEAAFDGVALAGRALDVELAHRRRMHAPASVRQTGVASRGRAAAAWSMARRRSSRPAGSNS